MVRTFFTIGATLFLTTLSLPRAIGQTCNSAGVYCVDSSTFQLCPDGSASAVPIGTPLTCPSTMTCDQGCGSECTPTTELPCPSCNAHYFYCPTSTSFQQCTGADLVPDAQAQVCQNGNLCDMYCSYECQQTASCLTCTEVKKFPVTGKPDRYLLCVPGQPVVEYTCTPGTLFDVAMQRCLKPSISTTTSVATTTAGTTTTPTTTPTTTTLSPSTSPTTASTTTTESTQTTTPTTTTTTTATTTTTTTPTTTPTTTTLSPSTSPTTTPTTTTESTQTTTPTTTTTTTTTAGTTTTPTTTPTTTTLSPSTSPTTTPTTTTASTPTTTTTAPPIVVSCSSCTAATCVYADPNKCTRYFACILDTITGQYTQKLYTCSNSRYYDPVGNKCSADSGVCGGVRPLFARQLPVDNEYVCREAGKFKHPTCCKEYYWCAEVDHLLEAFSYSCPGASVFDPDTKRCSFRVPLDCVKGGC